jgi:hypothetical protein
MTPLLTEAEIARGLGNALDEFQNETGVLVYYDTAGSPFAYAREARLALLGHLAAALCRPAEAVAELRARHPRKGG